MGKRQHLSRGIWESPEQRKEARLDMARAGGEDNGHSKRQDIVREHESREQVVRVVR